MEVAASLPNVLKVFPLRIMARDDFSPLQQVALPSEAEANEADEEMEEGEIEWKSSCRHEEAHTYDICVEQQYNGAKPFLAKSSSHLHPHLTGTTSAPCFSPPPIRTHDKQLERSVDALLSCRDKFSSPEQSKNRDEQLFSGSPQRKQHQPVKSTCCLSPLKQAQAPLSGQTAAVMHAPLSAQQLPSLPQLSAKVSPSKQTQACLASSRLCSPRKQTGPLLCSKKQVLCPQAKHSALSPTAERAFKHSSSKAPIPQENLARPPSAADGLLLPKTRASSPPKYHCQVLSLPNRPQLPGRVVEQKDRIHLESPVQLSLQTSAPLKTQGPGKSAFITCANGNRRPRSSAVRDYPEGCGKNLSLKLHGEWNKSHTCLDKVGFKVQTVPENLQSGNGLPFNIEQARKEQHMSPSQESHPQRPVRVMEDMAGLCLHKLPDSSVPLSKTLEVHVSLKRKHDSTRSSPGSLLKQVVKKPKVWHSSRMLSSVKGTLSPTTSQARKLQIDWLPEKHYDHAPAKRLVKFQCTKRLIGSSSKGIKFAKKSVIPLEEKDKLLPAEVHSGVSARFLVKRTLQEFDCVRRSLAMSKNGHQRPDLAAAKILKNKGRWRNCGSRKIIGVVPGVEVGDQFSFRIEMLVIGLHRQVQGGIDYTVGTACSEGPLATSIVASGGYEDDDDYGDTFIYTGQGGNNYKGDRRQACDQVLHRGNLALSNSCKKKSPVRVIRGSTTEKLYTYDGLYDVIDCWFQTGAAGFGVYQFKLARRPGQSELGSSIVRFVGSVKKNGLARPHLLMADISQGKETRPICVVNEVDEEMAPTLFNYITKMRYPSWYLPGASKGCDCIGGCVDASNCLCAAKNGGEFPYNEFGQIVTEKNVVFECGKSCACSGSCHNRLSQRGPKHLLEVFKTKMRGWGVRSLEPIRPGVLICEYVGELLSDADAEQKIEKDEYLFDIGNKTSTWSDDVSKLMDVKTEKSIVPVVEDAGYTIDARLFGSVARFINHSCSPNLYAQNVVYDSDDLRFPHVMLFSVENVPPMRELSYDYNYSIGHVKDANGKVKSKACYCGAQDCRGRLY